MDTNANSFNVINRSGGADLAAQGDINIGGDVVGRDKIVSNIRHIYQRALTAAEEAERNRNIEVKHLADGVSAFAQRLQTSASEKSDPLIPYRGLLEYRLNDVEIFFGRNEAICELLGHLEHNSLTLLHSESGAGKTSLLQAGISSRLIIAGHLPIYLRLFSSSPILGLKQKLLPNLNLAPILSAASLHDFLWQVRGVVGEATKLYILIDQFEEFFTQVEEEDRAVFVRELAQCLDDVTLNVYWILSLRSEYFADLASFRPLIRNPFENDYRLNRLMRAEAQLAMIGPAAILNVEFEPELVDTILDDLGGNEISPPQIQLVCLALYEGLGLDDVLVTRSIYERLGGVPGILGSYLDRVLSRNLPSTHRDNARRVLETLITSEGQRAIRNHAELTAELIKSGPDPETINFILTQLVDSRLLRTHEDSVSGELAYELAHEYLLEKIKLDPATQARKAAQELLDQEVRIHHRYATSLINEERLGFITQYRDQLVFTPEAETLFRESEATAHKARVRRERLQRRITLGLAVGLVVALVLVVLTATQWRRAQNEVEVRATTEANLQSELKIATSRELAAAALNNLSIDPERSLLLAIEAVQSTYTFEAEDSLRRALLASPQSVFHINVSQRSSWAQLAAFSPNGQWVAAISDDNTARVWEAATGRVVSVLRGHEDAVLSVAFSPDNRWLVTASNDNTARVWNVVTGQEVSVLRGHEGGVYSAVFSPNGQWIATASAGDDTARVWEAATGRVVSVLRGHEDAVLSVAFSPDNRWLVTASNDNTARVWNVVTGQEISVLQGNECGIDSAVFSPNGQWIATASAGDLTACVWEAATGRVVSVFRGHQDRRDLLLKKLQGKSGKNLIVQTSSSTKGKKLAAPAKGGALYGVWSVAFSPDGQLVITAGADMTARIWEAATGREVGMLSGYDGAVYSAVFSPNGQWIATGGWGSTARIWNVRTGQEIAALRGHQSDVVSVMYDHNGYQLMTVSLDGTARVWNVFSTPNIEESTGQELMVLHSRQNGFASAVFNIDNQIITTGGYDGSIQSWEITTGREVTVVQQYTGAVFSIACSPNSKWVVAAMGDNTARVLEVATGNEVSVLRGHENIIGSVAFNPNSDRIVTASSDGTARVWEATTGREVAVLKGHLESVNSAVFSPNGQWIATASNDITVRMWDSATGQQVAELQWVDGGVAYAAFSPDGKRIITTGGWDNTARIWDVEEALRSGVIDTQIAVLQGHGKRINSAVFDSSGHWVVTASDDGTARIWDATTGKELAVLRGHYGPVKSATFSSDRRWVMTIGDDGTIRIYATHIEDLLDFARQRVTRELSCEERVRYLNDRKDCETQSP